MRLILHAGTHKTGTTTVQEVLAANRSWLRTRGVIFPALPGCSDSHNGFAHRLALADASGLRDLRDQLRARTGPDATLVLSAEEFSARILGERHWEGFDRPDYWQRRRAYLVRLREIASGLGPPELLICYRRADQYAASLYATNLLSDRFRWSFAEFLTRCAPLFDFSAQLALIREVFPGARAIPFDTLRPDLVPRFCAWAGLPVPPGTGRHSKITPDARVIAWLHARRAAGGPERQQARATEFARQPHASAPFRTAPRAWLWPSDAARRAFLASATEPESGFFTAGAADAAPARCVTPQDLDAVEAAFAAWRRGALWRAVTPAALRRRIARTGRLRGAT